ncbi:MAG: CsiV family protein [Legionellales bacterium]
MQRFYVLTLSILYSCFTLASSSYQVDLILFTQPQSAAKNSAIVADSPFIPIIKNAISLKPSTKNAHDPYQLLNSSQSGLKNEYYLLNHKPAYQIIGHYSWIQPAKNQSAIALPDINTKGWQVQGTVRVQQSNYYLLDATIQCSAPNNPQSSFTVSQKQRLKEAVVYYLDHPQVGMLVKIHKLMA